LLYVDPNSTHFLENLLPQMDEWRDEATEVEAIYEAGYRRMCYEMAFSVSDSSVRV